MVPLPLPDIRDVTSVLESLFGREVTAHEAGPMPLSEKTGAVITLLDDSNRVRALWMFDLELANLMGTALAVGHPDKAAMATQTGVIPTDIRENLAEVVNVGVSAINGEGRIHVALGPMAFADDGRLSSDLWRRIRSQHSLNHGRSLSHRVSISGYGSGRMVICSLASESSADASSSRADPDDDWDDLEFMQSPPRRPTPKEEMRARRQAIPRGPRSFIRWGTQARAQR